MDKPYFWKARKGWYVKDNSGGKRRNVFLSKDEEEAFTIWEKWRRNSNIDSPLIGFAPLAELFLDSVNPENSNSKNKLTGNYFRDTVRYLNSFAGSIGAVACRDLKPHHVTSWFRSCETWGDSSRRAAVAALKRCLNWCVSEGYIESNPLSSVEKPETVARECTISADDHRKMMEYVDCKNDETRRISRCFRAVLIALKHSGQRPSTIAKLTFDDVSIDGDFWILKDHKTKKKTQKPLVVYPSPCLQTLVKIIRGKRSTGRVFLNSVGGAWNSGTISKRVLKLRRKLELSDDVIAYAYRHTFATEALANGVDVATVAELLGHGDIAMVQRVYGHLAKKKSHLKEAAARAVKSDESET